MHSLNDDHTAKAKSEARDAVRLARPSTQDALTDGDVYTLTGSAEVARMKGESDMPAAYLDIARRIALAIGDKHLADRVTELATDAIVPPPA